jgi:hypothetical protein
MSGERLSRREIIKKAAYIAPIILTLPANFSFASAGSGDSLTTGGDKWSKRDQSNDFLNMTNKTRSK